MEITCNNVNDGLNAALWLLQTSGVGEVTRNGKVIALPEPLLITYKHPKQRVLFWEERDQNPFFTLMEAIWMIAGRDDLKFVKQFNKNMANFSDDGVILNGAYGHRWRNRFGTDQLKTLINHFKSDRNTRRAVLTMWGVEQDLRRVEESHDVCCNTHAYFDLRGDVLNMTVCNRSNDVIWGCFGANAVHFSFLQEFLAYALEVDVGVYRQFSNNLHIYEDLYDISRYLPPPTEAPDNHYEGGQPTFPIISTPWREWLEEAEYFCDCPLDIGKFHDPFFRDVAQSMALSWYYRKQTGKTDYSLIEEMPAWDWSVVCYQWLKRRDNVKKAA